MAIDFPNTPATGDKYGVGNRVWQYDGTDWVLLNSGTAIWSTGPTSITAIWTGNQAAYDAISPKDSTTLYVVTA